MPKTIPCWDCKGKGCKTCNQGGVLSVYTESELNKIVKDERTACIEDGYRLSAYNTPQDMCQGSALRAYSKGQDNFAKAIRNRGE